MAFRTDHLLARTWRAQKKNKPVIMLSTSSSAKTVMTPSRHASAEPVVRSQVLQMYNQHMTGVDIADQHSTYYSFLGL